MVRRPRPARIVPGECDPLQACRSRCLHDRPHAAHPTRISGMNASRCADMDAGVEYASACRAGSPCGRPSCEHGDALRHPTWPQRSPPPAGTRGGGTLLGSGHAVLSDRTLRGHRSPHAVIGYAVRLYHRVTLSCRDVEERLLKRGSCGTRESVCSWSITVGDLCAQGRRHREPQPGSRWRRCSAQRVPTSMHHFRKVSGLT